MSKTSGDTNAIVESITSGCTPQQTNKQNETLTSSDTPIQSNSLESDYIPSKGSDQVVQFKNNSIKKISTTSGETCDTVESISSGCPLKQTNKTFTLSEFPIQSNKLKPDGIPNSVIDNSEKEVHLKHNSIKNMSKRQGDTYDQEKSISSGCPPKPTNQTLTSSEVPIQSNYLKSKIPIPIHNGSDKMDLLKDNSSKYMSKALGDICTKVDSFSGQPSTQTNEENPKLMPSQFPIQSNK